MLLLLLYVRSCFLRRHDQLLREGHIARHLYSAWLLRLVSIDDTELSGLPVFASIFLCRAFDVVLSVLMGVPAAPCRAH